MNNTLQESFIEFVAAELSVKPSRLASNISINLDLGVDGDDGLEFMAEFSKRFGVNISYFNAAEYFGPEGTGNPLVWFWWFVTRSGPKLRPLTLGQLQASISMGRWVSEH